MIAGSLPPDRESHQDHQILIRGGTLLTMAPSQRRPFCGDVLIKGTQIAEVGPDLSVSEDVETLDATGLIVLPGLVNAHLHSSEAFFKGRYDRLAFDAWGLYAYPLLSSVPMTEELLYLRTLAVGIEALKSGVTFVVDDIADQIAGQQLDGLRAVVKAYCDLGIRATCSGNVMNRHALETLPVVDKPPPEVREILALPLPSVRDFLTFCEAAYAEFHGLEGRIRFMVAPVAPQWCTDEMLVAVHDFAHQRHLQFHTHVLETKAQALIGQDHYNGSLVNHLANLGVLSQETNLIHAVWTSEKEIELIAKSGASVVHNPHSNLKLGSGISPMMRYLRSDIPLGLGTDGLASNDSARLFDVTRLAVLLHRLQNPDPIQWPSAYDVVQAATLGGARVALMSKEVGTLEPGKQADLIMLDSNSWNFMPLNNPYNHLAFCEDGSSVRHTIVNGRVLVSDGQITTVDEADIKAELRARVSSYLSHHAAVEERHLCLQDYMTKIDIAASQEFDRRFPSGKV